MNYKNYILISVIFLSFIFLSLKENNNYQKTNGTYLIEYGEYIFQRESCMNCHTLHINDNANLISLDGLKNKYSEIWHYSHLVNPESVSYGSTMPSFKNLTTEQLDFKTFISKLKRSEQEWSKLIYESDSVFKNLRNQYIELNEFDDTNNDIKKRTEILALIAYLQNIPASKDYIKKDSINNVEFERKIKNLDNLISDSKSYIYKNIGTKESIEKGKVVFKQNCFMCHGENGEGRIGPNLTDNYWLHGNNNNEILKVIAYGGTPGKGMVGWNAMLEPEDFSNLVSFINSINGTNPKNAKISEGKKY